MIVCLFIRQVSAEISRQAAYMIYTTCSAYQSQVYCIKPRNQITFMELLLFLFTIEVLEESIANNFLGFFFSILQLILVFQGFAIFYSGILLIFFYPCMPELS